MKNFVVALSSLCAEGTPVLALELFRHWRDRYGLNPALVVLSRERNELEDEFTELGIEPLYLSLPSGKFRYASMAHQVATVVRARGAKALLSFPLGWHTFLGFGAKWGGAERVVAHVGNFPPYWTGLAFDKFRFEIQAGRPVTDSLVCCSDYVRDGVIEYFGVSPQEAVTVYNGCPVFEFAARAQRSRSNRTKGPFRVGMVARLEIHKDQPSLIRAVALLRSRNVDVEAVLVGDGSRRGEYEKLISELRVESAVKLLGTRRDVPEQLGQMDAFVFSAKRDEGFGVALVEAMAAGTPVIATDVGACREVLQDGRSGLLVPPHSPEALADAIDALRSDHDRAAALTKAARERAAEFTVAAMSERYLELMGITPG